MMVSSSSGVRGHRSEAIYLALVITALVAGCGKEGDAGDLTWPKRVTLSSPAFAQLSEPVRLMDGKLAADGGDMSLLLAVQLSLADSLSQSSPNSTLSVSFCEKGIYANLADVPTDVSSCAGAGSGGWTSRLFLSAATPHTDEQSAVIGRSALVQSRQGDAIYRLRILGDTVSLLDDGSLGRATAKFEYEPVRLVVTPSR